MQKVVGSSPIIRLERSPAIVGLLRVPAETMRSLVGVEPMVDRTGSDGRYGKGGGEASGLAARARAL
jgi:hypothetical protein